MQGFSSYGFSSGNQPRRNEEHEDFRAFLRVLRFFVVIFHFAYLITKIRSSIFVLCSILLIVTVQSLSAEPTRPSALNCILYLWGSVNPSTERKSSKSSVRV